MLDYVLEWNHKSAIVKTAVEEACPGSFPGFMAPSLVLLDSINTNGWTAQKIFDLGYDEKNLTKELSFHKCVFSSLKYVTQLNFTSHQLYGCQSGPY